jgi:hypothetical protein
MSPSLHCYVRKAVIVFESQNEYLHQFEWNNVDGWDLVVTDHGTMHLNISALNESFTLDLAFFRHQDYVQATRNSQ